MHLTKRVIQIDDKGTKLKLEFEMGDEPASMQNAMHEAIHCLQRRENQMELPFDPATGEVKG